MTKTLKISDSKALELYKTANKELKEILEETFTKEFFEPKDIMKVVKNFDDILRISGKKLEDIHPFKNPRTNKQKSQNAFARILLIEEVLNEGWIPDWNNKNEYKYYPYFEFRAHVGWVFCLCRRYYCVSFGSVAYFKNSNLAIFAGKIFIEDYKEFLNR